MTSDGAVAMTVPLTDGTHQLDPGCHAAPALEVAVAILLRPSGELLLTSRPSGKTWAGYWELPGGKIEAGESPQQALRRELLEELGIICHTIIDWRCLQANVAPAGLKLHCCKVTDWSGQLQMRERQNFCWQSLPASVAPILPATLILLDWLAAEAHQLPASPTPCQNP